MATWSGWQIEFFQAARIINTPPNQRFLTEWANHASSPTCHRNPIDLHYKVGTSTNCVKPAGFTNWTQNYARHADAAAAFAHQVNSNAFAAILDTLGTGNPFQDPGYKLVVAALRKWPSVNFATWYESQVTGSSGGGGGGGGGGSGGGGTGLHKAWGDVRRSLNHKAPAALGTADSTIAAALRQLSHARRVVR